MGMFFFFKDVQRKHPGNLEEAFQRKFGTKTSGPQTIDFLGRPNVCFFGGLGPGDLDSDWIHENE